MHHALAEFYTPGGGDILVTLDAWYDKQYENYPEFQPDLVKDHDLARAMCEGYLQWVEEEGVDADFEVIAAEQEIEAPFATIRDVPVTLIGKLDLVVRRKSDGARLFLDHKSVGNLTDLPKLAQISLQFQHYALLQRLTQPKDEWCAGGVYNMIRKVKRTRAAKPPFFGRWEVRHSDEALRSYWQRTMGVVSDMIDVRTRVEAGESFLTACYPNPGKDCTWSCPFFQVCPFGDAGDAEAIFAEQFTTHDPYERYITKEATA